MHEGSWLRRVFRGSLTEKMIFILLLYFKKLKNLLAMPTRPQLVAELGHSLE